MKKMGLNEIREKYLDFFESKEHLRMPSFSLIPKNDPSILLINAGMTPLKPYFTGDVRPPAPRVTTCQKCIRTPDIERVGKTSRHGTFFEMLGNFSFGDYFKEDAIKWAWEFCTQVLEMPVEKLAVTVYEEDDEAYGIWKDIVGLPESKIFRMGKEDNFWEHGTGPCGPCSEIFFDRGEDKGCRRPDCNVGCDCDRFVEFWNLVFTQFNKEEDGSYTPLKKKNIDTGGGLERFACIMQDVDNLFEVDTVRVVLDHVCRKLKVEYGKEEKKDIAIRVITDHTRSAVMMISDGILPDNAGRGYVLRRILRRASRYARILGTYEPFLFDAASVVINESAGAYPELRNREELIRKVILKEEESFARTISAGSQMLSEHLEKLKASGEDILPGDIVFKLHDTFGFPMDLTKEIAEENGCRIDQEGFDEEMKHQKKRNREIALSKCAGNAWDSSSMPEELKNIGATDFTGYEKLEDSSRILAILRDDEEGGIVEEAGTDEKVILVTEKSPFYGQSGGQTGDKGTLNGKDFSVQIKDTNKTPEGIILHIGIVEEGVVTKGDKVVMKVDKKRRLATARNHTVTHMLHKALREVLGEHVTQAGSEVSAEKLRFDFSHFEAMTPSEKEEVENKVNNVILENMAVTTEVMTQEHARASGAMALFDEKYSDKVRVVSVGNYSKELCGGTHLDSSSTACLFRIVSESAVAAGVRRIEGVTGEEAYLYDTHRNELLKAAADTLKISPQDIGKRVKALTEQVRELEKKAEIYSREKAKDLAEELVASSENINGIPVVFKHVEAPDQDSLRNMADLVRDRIGGVVLLSARSGEKLLFVCMADKEAVKKGAHAGQIVKIAAQMAGGGGGGRPDMAQAGGRFANKGKEALEAAKKALLEMIT